MSQTPPLIDLHAHLSGSIPKYTFIQLFSKYLRRQNPVLLKHKRWLMEYYSLTDEDLDLEAFGEHSSSVEDRYHDNVAMPTLAQCFILFDCIHVIIQEKEDFQLVVNDVLTEYSKECVYLELRTTPRELRGVEGGKSGYVKLLVEEIEKFVRRQRQDQSAHQFLKVNVLLSINRTMSQEEAKEILDLTLHYAHETKSNPYCSVIGMDFSGNPTKNSFSHFSHLFLTAVQNSLTLAVHFAEVFNDEDTNSIIEFLKSYGKQSKSTIRLGHGCCMSDEQLEHLLETCGFVPIEICLTSNNIAGMVKEMENHLVRVYLEKNHPFVLCCDDRGIFSTSLQQEFEYLEKTFGVNKEQQRRIQMQSIEHIGELDTKMRSFIREEYLKNFS